MWGVLTENSHMNEMQELTDLTKQLFLLPKTLLKNIHHKALPELLLKKMCQKNFFDLKQAVYCLDNPEFDCFKGIAGYNRAEPADLEQFDQSESWDLEETHPIIVELVEHSFNQAIKNLRTNSFYKNYSEQRLEKLYEFGKSVLQMEQPEIISWESKHGNHGIFFYEPSDKNLLIARSSLLEYATSLLSLTHF